MNSNVEIDILPDGRMDTANTAKYIGRKQKTLAQWRLMGRGPRYVKAGRIYYFKSDVDDWLNQRRSGVGQ